MAASASFPTSASLPTSAGRHPAAGAPATSATALLRAAHRSLEEATVQPCPPERYAAAHLAALRAAAAVLAARARPDPGTRRRGPRSVWTMVPTVAPELLEWAAFFAAGAGKRAAAEAGLPRAVTARESDDLVRDADAFLGVVERLLGLDHQLLLPAG